MIVLDTNVLSEALRPSPSETVLRFLAAQDRGSVFATAITQAEVLLGVEVLPADKRRTRLHTAVENLFAEEFRGRILPFDEDSGRVFPKIVAVRCGNSQLAPDQRLLGWLEVSRFHAATVQIP